MIAPATVFHPVTGCIENYIGHGAAENALLVAAVGIRDDHMVLARVRVVGAQENKALPVAGKTGI